MKLNIISFLKNNIAKLLVLFLAFFIVFLGIWIKKTFGIQVNYIELVYSGHLALSTITTSDKSYIIEFYLRVVNLSIISSLIFTIILEKLQRIKVIKNYFTNILIFNVNSYLIYGIIFFVIQFKFHELARDYVTAYLNFNNNQGLYEDPYLIDYKNPESKKNLILFYYEALENNIENLAKNTDLHKITNIPLSQFENPIKLVQDIKGKNVYDFKEVPTADFSIAGVISSQCSLPYYPIVSLNIHQMKDEKMFCMSDVLSNHDYEQIFYITVEKKFHGFQIFKENHKYKIHDKNIVKNDFPDVDPDGWGDGVFDNDLLRHAKQEIIKLHKSNKRFNVTLINTDTHAPYIMSPKCGVSDELKTEDLRAYESYKCSSKYIRKFFDDLENEGVLENTVVVILGDHLAYDWLSRTHRSHPSRNVFFKINTKKEFTRSKMNNFDVAPTILDEMGFFPEKQDKFGFGVSLFNKNKDFDYDKHYKSVMNKKILTNYYLKLLFKDKNI